MRIFAVIALCVAMLAPASSAQDWKQVHKADDAKWAKETGLDPGTIHKLWRQASHFPNEKDDDSRIASVDVEGLADRHQVLLVTYAGEKNCQTLTVFHKYSETSYTKLWWAGQTPDGQGFCDTPFGGVDAEVREGIVEVRVPHSQVENSPGYVNYTVYNYEWNGITYRFTGQKEMQGRQQSP